nr:ribonuclease H-like domain-containing protein [Tanacetum cinerariifolium]
MLFKVDFEKAFDSLSYPTFYNETTGFSSKWSNWILSCLNSLFASILIIGSLTKEFKLERGLRQGDPLFPFLFIIAVEALNIAILEATNYNIFYGFKIAWEKVLSPHNKGGIGIGRLSTSLIEDFTTSASSGPWSRIMKLKTDLNLIGIDLPMLFKKKVANGQNTRFWHDNSLRGVPLQAFFPRLYRLRSDPNCIVYERNITASPHRLVYGPGHATGPGHVTGPRLGHVAGPSPGPVTSSVIDTTMPWLKSHVEEDNASTNPEWFQLDDLIMKWILGSLCDPLQEQVDARAINLDNELRAIKIGKMTVNECCTKVQSMTNRLKNLDCQKESSFNDQTNASSTFESSYSSLSILMASFSNDTKGNPGTQSKSPNNLQLCNNFNRGACKFADQCKFIHDHLNRAGLSTRSNNNHTNGTTTISWGSANGQTYQQDFLTRHILLRCDSSGDLYLVTKSSNLPVAFVSTSSSTWHQHLGHPGDEMLHSLTFCFISYNKEKSSYVCHACQLDPNWCNAMYDEYNVLVKMLLRFLFQGHLMLTCSNQQHGVDFDKTFSLVVKPATIRTVLSLAVSQQRPIHQLDVKNAGLCMVGNRHLVLGFSGLGYATRAGFSPRLFLSQKKYALQLLEYAHMVNCNPSRTPVDTDSKLGEPHFAALKRILRYVQGTLELGLHLYASATTSLVGYTDADWASCPTTRRFTLGYCVFLVDNLLSWSAKRQHTISRSSAEAKYQGVANVVAETAWIRNLLRELYSPFL